MKLKSKKPYILASSIGASLGLAAVAFVARADSLGVFSTSGALGGGDESANVGLSTGKTYLQAIDLGDTTNSVVNNVNFTGSGGAVAPSGNGWALTGTLNLFGGGGTIPGGALGALTDKFVYGGLPATLSLTGLTVGQTYVITFYDRSWETAGQRVQNITASNASTGSITFDENIGATGQGNLNLLRYTFQASSTTQAISIAPQNPGNTMHLYAFTNEQTFNNSWTSGTNWTSATWSVGVPNAAGANANFTAQAAPTSITLDAPQTVGHVQFDGTNAWTIAGSNTLSFQADVGGVSVLSALSGTHTISTPVDLSSDLFKMGSGAISLNGAVSGFQAITVNAGTLTLGATNSYTGGTTVNSGGTLRLGAAGALGTPTAGLTVNTGGSVDVNGNAVNIGSLAGTGGTITNNAASTSALITIGSGGASNSTYVGALTNGTGTIALTKAGTGTLTLTGANTYSGLTTITSGRLQLNGIAATGTLATSGITVRPGATLGFTAGATSTLALKTGSTLTLAGGTLSIDLSSAGATDKITADTLALTANSALTFTPISAPTAGTTYTLATYNTLSNPGNFQLSGATAGRLTLNPVIGATAITLTPALDSGVWNKASGGTWSAGPWTNYTPGVSGDSAVFGPALTSSGVVTVDTPRSVGYLTFNNTNASYTIGTAGSSNLTLNNDTAPAVVFVDAGSHTIAESVALASDVLISTASGTALAVSGTINGGRALTKSGPGTLLFLGANSYTGGTTISGGTLQLGDGATNGSTVGNITNNATLAINNPSALTITGAITGTGLVTKAGAGSLTLTGNSAFTGGMTITAGNVDVGGDTANGSVTGTIVNNTTLRFSRTGAITLDVTVNGPGNTIVAGGVSAAAGATLSPTASINTPNLMVGDATKQGWLNFSAPNQLNGATGVLLTIAANAANSRINLLGFSQTISGLIGTGIVQSAESGTVPAATLTINVPGTNSYSWTGLIRNQAAVGPLALTKTGTGEQIMNFSITNPTYSGATTVSQGRLVFGSTIAAPVWSTSGISVAAGAELGLTGAGAGVVSWSEGVPIAGAGSLVRTGADANTVTITNANNSFTGTTKLTGTGVLAVNTLANIGTNSSIGTGIATSAATNAASLVLDGGTLRYLGGSSNTDRLFTLTQNGGTLDASGIAALNLTNAGTIATSGSGARTLSLTGTTIDKNTLAAILPDGAGGPTSVIKDQAGSWILAGANTYTGSTTINGGRLQFEAAAATGSRPTSNLIVNTGGTFGFTAGTGSTLTLAGAFTLGGGTTVFDLGSAAGSDKIASSTLALTGNSTFSFNQIGSFDVGTTYTLATYASLSNPGGFTLGGFSAGRLSLTPTLGPTAITMIPVLDNGVWNKSTGSTWTAGPWTNYTPNAVGDAALFGTALTTSGVVTVDSPKTVGYLTFNNSAASYTIGTPFSANLTLANSGTAAAQVVVSAGTHTIAEDVTLGSDLSIFTTAGTSLALNGAINGFGNSVTKNGAGTLALNGAGNFATIPGSAFNINQGTVVLGAPTALSTATTVAMSGGTLNLNALDATIGTLQGTGGVISDNALVAGATTLTVNQTGNSVFNGVIADGTTRTVAVTKSGTGVLTLGGANTFSGGLLIQGGSVIAASGGAPAIPGSVTLGDGSGGAIWLIPGAATQQYGPNTVVTFANAGTDAKLELRGTNQTLAGVDSTPGQSLSIIQNDETIAPGYTSAPAAVTLTLNTATDHSFYGLMRNQDGGPLSILKTGPGTQEFVNRQDLVGIAYSGDTTINGGKLVLNLSGGTAAAWASNISVNGSGTLGLDGNWTLTRPVTGTGNVVKQGFGVVTVSGALSHTGSTTIAAGTLMLTGSIAGSATIDVQSGATLDVTGVAGGFVLGAAQTLKGSGSVSGNATINGTLSPGTGLGALTTGALAFGSGSTFSLEINTSSVLGTSGDTDFVSVNGPFSISPSGAASLSLTDIGSNVTLPLGVKFSFLNYTGAWNGGFFKVGGNTIADDSSFIFGANRYRLDYNDGGNTISLTTVPEPATTATLLLGLTLLSSGRPRRRSRAVPASSEI